MIEASDRAEAPAGDDDALSLDMASDRLENIRLDEDQDPEVAEVEDPDEDLDLEEGDESEADSDADEDSEEDDSDDDQEDDEIADIESALVRMKDGREITVAELRDFADKRVTEMQRQMTQTQMEYSERAKSVEQAASTIAQERDFILEVMEQIAPAPPDKSMREEDFMGYQMALEDYQQWEQQLGQLRQFKAQQDQAKLAELKQRADQESEILFQKLPRLKDEEARKAFQSNLVEYVQEIGGDPALIDQVNDHLFFVMANDAIKYRNLAKKSAKTKAALKDKPKVIGKRRANKPKPKNDAFQRLSKSGSMQDARAALQNLDL